MRETLRKHLTRALAAVAVFAIALGIIPQAMAATATPNNGTQSGNNGLQISPTRTDLAVNPGESSTFQISLKNISSIPLTAKATLNDFESDDQTGIPKLIIDPSQHSPRSIKPFLKGFGDVPLQSGETKSIQLEVNVPASAAPGGYYGALRYSAIPVNTSQNVGPNQISLTASVASLVLLEINGQVNEQLNFDSMNALRHGTTQAIFFGKGPDQIAIRLTNKGNGFSQPIGHVVINKGGKSVYNYEFNSTTSGLHSTILPDSSRTFTNSIKNVNGFGQYTVVASIAYKQGDEALTLSQKFWVIPRGIEYVLLVLVILIAAGIGLWQLATRRAKTKR